MSCPCLVGVPGPPEPGGAKLDIACCGCGYPEPAAFIVFGLFCGDAWNGICPAPPWPTVPEPALSFGGRGLLRPRGSLKLEVDEVGVAWLEETGDWVWAMGMLPVELPDGDAVPELLLLFASFLFLDDLLGSLARESCSCCPCQRSIHTHVVDDTQERQAGVGGCEGVPPSAGTPSSCVQPGCQSSSLPLSERDQRGQELQPKRRVARKWMVDPKSGELR